MTPREAAAVLCELLDEAEFTHERLRAWGELDVEAGCQEAYLWGEFSADQLEAVATWMMDPKEVSRLK